MASFVANAAALVGPAVVRVDVERGEGRPEYSHASGFVYDGSNCLVLTNAHVVQGATRVAVVTAEGDRKDATVLGVDAHTDLAVLKVADARNLPEAELGDDVALRVGDWVVAIGHPIGLDHTVTLGIVSSKGRSIASPVMSRRDDESGARRWADRVRFIQTDAAINPGNSGGPLLDSLGKLVGMNTAIYSPSGASSGVGFAIPIDTLALSVASLIKTGTVLRPIMGVSFLEAAQAKALGIDKGVLVLAAPADGPAAAAGMRGTSRSTDGNLQLGDVIMEIDGRTVSTEADMFKALDARKPGESVKVVVARGQRVSADGSADDVVTVNVPLTVKLGGADDMRVPPPMAGRAKPPGPASPTTARPL
mmetsp:Transcript_30724/g.99746  ORF Transcript_30724/g.99746 Transcript_30724/m.99746 type:complete len:364 (-) Transcript_30724:39-1130(-)